MILAHDTVRNFTLIASGVQAQLDNIVGSSLRSRPNQRQEQHRRDTGQEQDPKNKNQSRFQDVNRRSPSSTLYTWR
uniref:Uncharacterized protein n=1 Tax=Candidatus Kentrum sp. FW TaxID=2126338 RepID=A0A450TEE1_9GAMM|nr:MAG: hypothetical protein BECKFW1821A_GA0114235_12012 [Candidatus Kentron sp. FW]